MRDYNDSTCDMAAEDPFFAAFPDRLHVGERAPEAVLEDLETGEPISLRSLASTGVAILEFGSFT